MNYKKVLDKLPNMYIVITDKQDRIVYPKNKKIKTYKKRDRQTNKVQQSQKRKKLFLFLHFLIYS